MGRPLGTKNKMRTPEEKKAIVLEYNAGDISSREISDKYNISLKLFYEWKRKYNEHGIDGLKSKTGRSNRRRPITKIPIEEELQRKIMKLEIENQRLKKGYVVKGVGAKKEYVTTFDVNMKS